MENKLKFSPEELTTDCLYNFYKIVEFAPVMVIVTDRDGKIEYVNERFEKINDYQWSEIKGKTPSFLQSGLTSEQTYQKLWSTISSGQIWQGEFCNQTKQGELYWQKVSIIPVTNQQEEITHFAAIERNIDQEKKLETELKHERDFLRRVIDTDPHFIFVKNWEGSYILANQALAEAYGTTPQELEGKRDEDFNYHPLEVEKFRQDDQEVMEEKEKKIIKEEPFTDNRGSLRWLQTIKVPINTNQPKHKRQVLGVATDITERKETKNKLKRERDKARKYLNVAKTIILIVNQNQKVELINKQGSQLLGLKEGAVIGSDWFENYIDSEIKSESMNLFRQIINADRIKELKSGLDSLESGYECKIVADSGEKRIIEWHGTVINDQAEQTKKLLLSGQDITNRKQIEKSLRKTNQQLKYRLKFEDLISNISTRFISLTSQDIDNGINWGLKKLGKFVDADRSYIFLIEEEKGELNNTHEWCAPGVESEIDNLQGLEIDTFPWIIDKLRNLEKVSIPDVAKLPPEAAAEKEILEAQDIKSALMIPIPYGKSLLGFIGIDSVADNAVWAEDILQLLKLVGEMFGNALKRREYEEELETSRERFKLSLWGTNQGLWDWNIETGEVFFNDQWSQMLGYSPEEIKNNVETWKKLIHPEDKPRVIKELEAHLAGETDYYETEHRLQTKSGGWKWVLDKGQIVSRSEDGSPQRMVGLHMDISKRKELDTMKSDLISTVSHEIRTPLSSVLGFTELLLEKDMPPEKSQRFLEIIHQESNRLKNLINDFLDIQRIESGHQDLNREQVDLGGLIKEVIELYQVHDSHQFNVKLLPEEIVITADFDKLKQLVTNLVSNAVKYSELETEIEIEVVSDEDKVQVAVKDQGIGIPTEAQDDLFDKFYRVKNSASIKAGGTGLGLAICKEIVQMHQGDIWVESTPGVGSTFYFRLPINQPEEEAE